MKCEHRLPGRAERQIRKILSRASDQSRWALGGRLKEGAAAPKPITLPVINFPDLDAIEPAIR